MLTDRQKRFYDRISSLSLNNSSATNPEKEVLWETEIYIDEGADFKVAINSMNLALKSFDKNPGLSPEVKKLYEDLVSIYGDSESGKKNSRQYPKKDWRDSDPDLIYTGTGEVSGWVKRTDKTAKTFKATFVRSLFSQLFFWGDFFSSRYCSLHFFLG